MRERFRRENSNPKRILIVLYKGDERQVSEVVELKDADAEPVRRLPQRSLSDTHSASRPNGRPQANGTLAPHEHVREDRTGHAADYRPGVAPDFDAERGANATPDHGSAGGRCGCADQEPVAGPYRT